VRFTGDAGRHWRNWQIEKGRSGQPTMALLPTGIKA